MENTPSNGNRASQVHISQSFARGSLGKNNLLSADKDTDEKSDSDQLTSSSESDDSFQNLCLDMNSRTNRRPLRKTTTKRQTDYVMTSDKTKYPVD
jgi:hypothetical protein